MTRHTEVVPDLGDFDSVPVIDVLVKPGDTVVPETPLVTLESDKATLDVPATRTGTVVEVLVSKGQKVGAGTPLAVLELGAAAASPTVKIPALPEPAGEESPLPTVRVPTLSSAAVPPSTPPAAPAVAPRIEAGLPAATRTTRLAVLGAGPGGYTAAFRAADLGLEVTLIDRWPQLGGVCLNVGCIPSKALLHAAKVIDDAQAMADHGIRFGRPEINLAALARWKSKVVNKLTAGLVILAKQRKVTTLQGYGRFLSKDRLEVLKPDGGVEVLGFEQCIIAVGSEPTRLPFAPNDPRIMDSTGALELADVPGRLLVVGGGIIGLEMACVYSSLGSKVTVVELTPGLMPGCDRDLVKPLEKRITSRYAGILTGTKVEGLTASDAGIDVRFSGAAGASEQQFDRVLVSVGRVPNGRLINAEAAGITVTDRGHVGVDTQMRTSVPNIFAIGDVVGQPMLAHKATHEGKLAAEVAAGEKRYFDARVIPSVAYTDPEVAWVGVTETQAKADGTPYAKGMFPWMASGRSLSLGRDEGFTKLLFDPETHRVIGGGIVGSNAGDLIAEVALAIEMGADAHDIGLTIHPHPTLSETVAFAAEAFEGTLTDLYLPKKK